MLEVVEEAETEAETIVPLLVSTDDDSCRRCFVITGMLSEGG
jgi:hypothetical protein